MYIFKVQNTDIIMRNANVVSVNERTLFQLVYTFKWFKIFVTYLLYEQNLCSVVNIIHLRDYL